MPDIKHIYTQSLENTHAAEQQGLQQMNAQIPQLDDYPEYQALLRGHVSTTEAQLTQIEQALSDVGASKPALREAVTSAVGLVGTAVHAVTPDTTLKNLYAGYAFQGEQIAAYTSLAVIAEQAGYGQHTGWIKSFVADEKAAAEKVEQIIPTVTEQFLAKHRS